MPALRSKLDSRELYGETVDRGFPHDFQLHLWSAIQRGLVAYVEGEPDGGSKVPLGQPHRPLNAIAMIASRSRGGNP
jgi:hypothetical protein